MYNSVICFLVLLFALQLKELKKKKTIPPKSPLVGTTEGVRYSIFGKTYLNKIEEATLFNTKVACGGPCQ